jgi:hypothetical protein
MWSDLPLPVGVSTSRDEAATTLERETAVETGRPTGGAAAETRGGRSGVLWAGDGIRGSMTRQGAPSGGIHGAGSGRAEGSHGCALAALARAGGGERGAPEANVGRESSVRTRLLGAKTDRIAVVGDQVRYVAWNPVFLKARSLSCLSCCG